MADFMSECDLYLNQKMSHFAKRNLDLKKNVLDQNYFESKRKHGFIDSLCIALGPEREVLELWHSYYIKRPLWNYILICTLMEEN